MKMTPRIDIEHGKRTEEEQKLLAAVNEELGKEIADRKKVEKRLLKSEAALHKALEEIKKSEARWYGTSADIEDRAKRVELELEYADRELHMRVRDDGIGIDPQVLRDGREGYWGLAGVRERTARIGGQLKISSNPTHGTEVRLSITSNVAFHFSATENSA